MEITYTIIFALIVSILSYFIGSIPTARIIAYSHGVDIMTVGSKNAGGTNVGRVIGKKAGILTIFLDAAKCFIPCLITLLILRFAPLKLVDYPYLNEIMIDLVAIFVSLGHSFSIFSKFKGGKCVACFSGFIVFISPIAAIIGGTTFFSILAWKHKVSLSSLIGAPVTFAFLLIPMILDFTICKDSNSFNLGMYFAPNFFLHLTYYTVITTLLLVGLITIRHKSNIERLEKGIEPDTHFKKD